MDMTTCVARRTRSRTESYLNSILAKSKGIHVEDQFSQGSLNSRTERKRVNMRDAYSSSPVKKRRRRRKVSEDDDDDVEFIRTDYPDGKRDEEHVDENVGSSNGNLESKSLDCGDRVCDLDLDDVNLRGEEKTSNLNPLSSDDDDDDDVEFIRTDYPGGKRDEEHVDVNVGSSNGNLEPKSIDCGDRVCDLDLDDGDLRGEEKTSNLNPLSSDDDDDDDVVFVETVMRENEHVEDGNVGSSSVISPRVCDFAVDDANLRGEEKTSTSNTSADDDDDVVFVKTIPGESERVEDGNVGSGVCDILLDDANLKGESVEVESLSSGSDSDDEEGSVEELGTDSGEEVTGEDGDSSESDSDDKDADYVGSSDSSDVESSDSDFGYSEEEEGGARDVSKGRKRPSDKVYSHEKLRTFYSENNLDVLQLLGKYIWDGRKVIEEDICSGDETAKVDCREDAIIRESSSEKVNVEQGKPRKPRSFHRVKEKNPLNFLDVDGGEKLCDGQATEDSPPLNLRFGYEEPVPIEKTEEEKEIDSLWEDMAFALTLEGMHSSTPAKKGDMLCSKGTHDFVLDEEIGMKCRHCSYVAVEIKDVSPAMDKYHPSVNDTKKCSDKKDDPLPNRLEFEAPDPGSYVAPLDNTEGTVWQYVPGIKDTLYPHQQGGFEFIWKNLAGTTKHDELNSLGVKESGGCVISHLPGTGKTRLTIVFIQSYLERFPDSHPVVIAPATMLLTWEEEFRKWNANIPFYNLNSKEFTGYENPSAVSCLKGNMQDIRKIKLNLWSSQKSILVVSYTLYEKLARDKYTGEKDEFRRKLLELPGLLVLDEGHTPRNQNSCIWKVLSEVRTEKRIILSGTPFQNNFKELSNVLCMARPAYREKIFSWLHELSKQRQEGIHGRFNEKIRIVDLRAMIAPFVNIYKGTILQESLLGLRDCVVVLNPPSLQKKILVRIDPSQNTFELEHKLSAVSVHPSLYLCCNPTKKERYVIGPTNLETLRRLRLDSKQGVKTRFLIDFIRISMSVNEKVLVYSQYIDTLKLIMEQLSAEFGWTEGEEILIMHGQLDQKYRQHLINDFNKPDSNSKVLLASIKACSEGISLVGASRVVILDVVWNPSVEMQAISRAYRLGQKRAVSVYHLMVKDTSEWDKYCRQSEKYRISELVFSSTNEKDKPINKEVVFEDRILDEMVRHEKLKDMFEKILYNPKESDMFTSLF